MRNLLRASSIATLAATVLSFGSPAGAFADGRADWKDYAWQQIKVASCVEAGAQLTCPPYHQKWDWKRNQWVDIAVTLDLAAGEFRLTQRLTNNASTDDDYVCVTALAVDAAGNDVAAHHQNLHMLHGKVVEHDFNYAAPRLSQATNIYIGSKQCRDGEGQDDALYARVLAAIPR